MTLIRETTDAIDLSGFPSPTPNYTMTLGDTFVGTFDGPDDVDGVVVTVESGWSYVLQVERVGAEGRFLIDLGRNESGFVPPELQSYDAEIGAEGKAATRVSTSGLDRGLLAAQFASDGYEGEYRATLTRELPDYIPSAARVAVGQNFHSSLGIENIPADRNGDWDVIGVRLEAGTPYRFGLTGDWTPSGGRALEVIRRAVDGEFAGDLDIFAEARFQTEAVSAAFTPEEDGLYYVRIRQQPGTEGVSDYSLAVREETARRLIGDDADNRIEGGETDDRIEGRGGNDALEGLNGNDTLLGGTGDDFLQGQSGDDLLNGGPGADTMWGSTGSDTYVVDDPGDSVFEETDFDNVTLTEIPDFDRVLASVDADISGSLDSAIESIEATGTRDIRLGGSRYDQALVGNGGDNILLGNGGDDTMTGGAGRDAFALSISPENGDFLTRDRSITVTDFEEGDRLAVDDRLLGTGTETEEVRRLTRDVFEDLKATGRVSWDGAIGRLTIDVDGDGEGEAVADLGPDPALGLEDVFLF